MAAVNYPPDDGIGGGFSTMSSPSSTITLDVASKNGHHGHGGHGLGLGSRRTGTSGVDGRDGKAVGDGEEEKGGKGKRFSKRASRAGLAAVF